MSSKGTIAVVALFVVAAGGVFALSGGFGADPGDPSTSPTATPDERGLQGRPNTNGSTAAGPVEMQRFDSREAFADYLRTAGLQSTGGTDVAFRTRAEGDTLDVPTVGMAGQATAAGAAGGDGGGAGGGAPAPERYSETNVQEAGIDEPDLLKTDGTHFYYAGRQTRFSEKYRTLFGETDVLSATPPGSVERAGSVNRTGKLLLDGDRLVVVGDEQISGFDVSEPADPELVWEHELPARVRTARLMDGTVYLVMASSVDRGGPCPIEPLGGTSVACTDVFHPGRPVPVDATYTATTLDPATGEVGEPVSWVGTHDSVVYMSSEGLYVTYTEQTPTGVARMEYMLAEDGGRPLLDEWVLERLERVESYELSAQARATEVRVLTNQWLASLPADRRERVRRELAEGFEKYVSEHRRSLATTHVVRVDVTDDGGLAMGETGSVPGRPLNQFSLDEHEGHLRIATTVGERFGVESANDVYVLDAERLEVTGEVTGMGEGQRVYAVRFVGDTGYVVTFRRVDPLHVLDLSDPANPTEEGELELPGFSTYLHPLSEDRVLGIGEEDGRVKAVVFDVSDPTDPRVADSKVLDARWSAVSRSHHAFLIDERHGVFFLPTESGGHVLSYEDGLSRVHTVEDVRPRRARYVDDYLYVFGEQRVVVVDETEWRQVASASLVEDDRRDP